MRTSATGRARGFTLIELLVVIFILGIAVGLVALNLLRGERDDLEAEARRLAVLLELARDEAIVTGRSRAWRADEAGYAFSPQQPEDAALRPRPWPARVRMAQLRIAGTPVPADTPLFFASSGINLPFELVLASGERRVAIWSDGAGRIARAP